MEIVDAAAANQIIQLLGVGPVEVLKGMRDIGDMDMCDRVVHRGRGTYPSPRCQHVCCSCR